MQDHADKALGASKTSHEYLRQAVTLAEQGLYTTDPNPRVGCIVVQGNEVVGQGAHWQAGSPHAERHALAQAGERAKGADVYVTLEPCNHYGRTPPCVDGLLEAGVARVVVGMVDPNPLVSGQGIARLREAGVAVSLLQGDDALLRAIKALNAGFLHRLQHGRPLVRLKLACSLDGRTAMADGESQWITGSAARADVHRLRARSSAIVTGINTVLMDNAKLTVRPQAHGLAYPGVSEYPFADFPFAQKVRQPLRVVLDSQFQLPRDHLICQQPGQTIIMGLEQSNGRGGSGAQQTDASYQSELTPLIALTSDVLAEQATLRVAVPADPIQLEGQLNRISLLAVLAGLGRLAVNEVLVEAGPTLAGAFVAAGLVDELWLYQAPKLLGHQGRPLAQLSPACLAEAPTWQFMSVAAFDEDMRYILVPKDCARDSAAQTFGRLN
jgi:diaminohydroxyphosphoribosylaminopyrimidine deaminase/5-amino-6-(5-phosphoribosylamino)uracil reductase